MAGGEWVLRSNNLPKWEGVGGTSLSGGLHNVLGEGDCHVSIHYVMEQCQSCTGPPVFQCLPPKAVWHGGHTWGGWEIIHGPSSSSALNHLKFGGEVFCMGVPCTSCIFQLRSNNGLICGGPYTLVVWCLVLILRLMSPNDLLALITTLSTCLFHLRYSIPQVSNANNFS